ncbi:hypothetical protein BKA70DRAFT_509111 [Coprinopsis sp. MPI-PUGE-AT-0042]|nr:hypothetical protein BKA70DRAFT_509111 [Coprinopsis sp. MPI-PUGE-AT-0042]
MGQLFDYGGHLGGGSRPSSPSGPFPLASLCSWLLLLVAAATGRQPCPSHFIQVVPHITIFKWVEPLSDTRYVEFVVPSTEPFVQDAECPPGLEDLVENCRRRRGKRPNARKSNDNLYCTLPDHTDNSYGYHLKNSLAGNL